MIRNPEQLNTEKSINIEGKKFQFDEDDFVRFGEVAISLLSQQSQYASRYINGEQEGCQIGRAHV